MADDLKALFEGPPEVMLFILQLAMWAAKGDREHGMELIYQDDEVMLFRRKTPFSEQLKAKGTR